jgi:drug/metabolite transporter (DMT)-like permease
MPGATGRRDSLTAALLLLAVTAVWGSTFAMTKDVVEEVPVMDFLAVRFLLAAVVVAALFPRSLRGLSAVTLRRGVVLGLLYGVAQVAQTVGLQHTAASVSGFVTGMYVVCTPLLAAVLLRERLSAATWAAVPLATLGLAVLSLRGVALGFGEGITLVAAVLYAVHIVALGAWSTPQEAIRVSVVQLLVIGLLGFVVGAPGGITLPQSTGVWLQVVYMAVFAAGLALAAQTWAQAHLPPTRAAIIMCTEPVFAALFAILIGGESMTSRLLVGGTIVLAAMLLAEVGPRRHVESEVPHLTV